MARRIATVCIIGLLLFLFIVPSTSLAEACAIIRNDTKGAITAVLEDDWDVAVLLLSHANDTFLQYRDGMHLYLNHEDISKLETSLRGCLQMAQIQENGQFLLESQHVLTHLEYLKSIESLTLSNLI